MNVFEEIGTEQLYNVLVDRIWHYPFLFALVLGMGLVETVPPASWPVWNQPVLEFNAAKDSESFCVHSKLQASYCRGPGAGCLEDDVCSEYTRGIVM